MNQIIEKKNIKIENMIYEVHGKQVMLDSDLAKLYQCKNGTKEINQAVKNNIEKFPLRFAFRINEDEYDTLKSIFLTSKTRGGSRKGHNVFTEQGVAMLATILKTPVATQINIAIMDAFIAMRKYISSDLLEQKYYNNMIIRHDSEIKLLQESFDKLQNNLNNNGLFFEGQIYDAYSLMINIFNLANKSIIIIDNYIDKNLLDVLSKTKKQYNNVNIKIDNTFHDRFIILDNKTLYHSGASFKDLGKKCFAITKIENNEWLNKLLKLI